MARVVIHDNALLLWASARDTYDWAHRPGARWPCSTLSGHRFFAAFDANGLYDLAVDGKDADCDGHELSACAADLLEASGKVPAEHPCRFIAIDQHL